MTKEILLYCTLYFAVSCWLYLLDYFYSRHLKLLRPVSSPVQWAVEQLLKKGTVADNILSFAGWIALLAPVSMPVIIVKRIALLFTSSAEKELPKVKCNICLNTSEYTGTDLNNDMDKQIIRCAFCNSTDIVSLNTLQRK